MRRHCPRKGSVLAVVLFLLGTLDLPDGSRFVAASGPNQPSAPIGEDSEDGTEDVTHESRPEQSRSAVRSADERPVARHLPPPPTKFGAQPSPRRDPSGSGLRPPLRC